MGLDPDRESVLYTSATPVGDRGLVNLIGEKKEPPANGKGRPVTIPGPPRQHILTSEGDNVIKKMSVENSTLSINAG